MHQTERGKRKNIIWGVVISYINVLISILYGFVSVPILLRALGKSEYGVYSTIASMIGYMSIMDFGIHNVLVRYLTKYRVKKNRQAYENLLATAFIIYGVISVVLFIAGLILFVNIPGMFANTFTAAEIQIARMIFWVVLADLVISLPGAVFQCVINAEEHFIFGRTTLGIKQLLKLAMVILVAHTGGRSLAFVLAVFGLNMGIIAIQALYAWRILHMKIKLHFWNWDYISSLFVYTSYVFIASVADQILWKLDSVILGMKVSAIVVAVYAVAMNLVTIYRKFSGAVSGIFLPRATEMSITDSAPEASVRLMTKVGIMQYSILSLVLVGFALVGKEFLFVWLGEGYDEVYIIFLILAAALLIPNCQSIGINILEARNRHRFRAVMMCVLALLNLVTTWFVVSVYGMAGAAACTAIAVLIGQAVLLNIYYWKALHLNIYKFFVDTFLKLLPATMVGGIVSWAALKRIPLYGTWWSLILKVIVAGILYTLFFLLLGGKHMARFYFTKIEKT